MVLFMSQVLGFSAQENSWLMTLLPIIALVRIPLSYLMRHQNLLDLMKWGILGKLALLVLLLALPYQALLFEYYTIFLIAYQVLVELGFGLAWNPMVLLGTQEKTRAAFLSRLGLFQLVSSLYTLLVSFFMGKELTSLHYRLLLLVAVLSLVLQHFFLRRFKEDKVLFQSQRDSGKMDWSLLKSQLGRHLSLILLDGLILYLTLTMNVLYMVQVLHLSAQQVSLYSSMTLLGNVLALTFLGPTFEKRRALFFISLLILTGCDILLLIALPKNGIAYSPFWSIGWGLLSGAVGSLWSLYISLLKHRAATPHPFTIWNIYQGFAYVISVLVFYLSGLFVQLSLAEKGLDLYRLALMICLLVCACIALVKLLTLKKTAKDAS